MKLALLILCALAIWAVQLAPAIRAIINRPSRIASAPARIEHQGMRTRKTSTGLGVIMPGFVWGRVVATKASDFKQKCLFTLQALWLGIRSGLYGVAKSEFGGAYFDLAAATAILKEFYDGQIVEDEIYKENPFYTMVRKSTEFGGKNFPIPLAYGSAGGGSTNFANAQANQTPAQYAEFLLTRRREYSLATLDNETAEAAGTDKGAFVDAVTDVVDKAIKNCTLAITSGLFRSGTGSLAQVSTTTAISTGVITLQDPTAITQFEVNMVLQFNATDGGASPAAALGYVVAADRFAGTLTVATSGFGGAAATPGSWTTSGYLLRQGDLNTKVSGLPAWLLASAPASTDNFYGVNRSADRWRLGGGFFNGSALPIEEAFVQGANLLGREGASPDMCFTNFQSYANEELALGSKVQYTELMANGSGDAVIAFEGIKINGPSSKITIIPDRSCQALTAYMLRMANWCLKSIGESPKILTYKDTNTYMRVVNADAMEARVGTYYNLYTNAPGWSEQISLGA